MKVCPHCNMPLFSPTQMKVLTYLSKGSTKKQISEALGYSVVNVKYHVDVMRHTLGCHNSMELLSKAYKLGIIK